MSRLVSERSEFFSEKKIKQIMAGYKANYNRHVNAMKVGTAKTALLGARDKFLKARYEALVMHNQIVALKKKMAKI